MTRTTRIFAFLPAASLVLASAFATDRKDGALPVPRLVAPQPGAERPRDEAPTHLVPPDELVRYGRDVRPILSDKCFQCHGQDQGKRAANLRLDRAEDATAAREHGAAVVPGSPTSSVLWQRLTTDDIDRRMPPVDAHKPPLTSHELDVIERWIAQGAVYEPHWAFAPPARVEPPAVVDTAWPSTPIDAFVLARLEREGIAPSPDAERSIPRHHGLAADAGGARRVPRRRSDRCLRAARRAAAHDEPYVSRYAERMATPWLDASALRRHQSASTWTPAARCGRGATGCCGAARRPAVRPLRHRAARRRPAARARRATRSRERLPAQPRHHRRRRRDRRGVPRRVRRRTRGDDRHRCSSG
jgi:hypothetical protein